MSEYVPEGEGGVYDYERDLSSRPAETAEQRAIKSLLDVVEELVQGIAHDQFPEKDWAEVVTDTFRKHRLDLLGDLDSWDEHHEVPEPQSIRVGSDLDEQLRASEEDEEG